MSLHGSSSGDIAGGGGHKPDPTLVLPWVLQQARVSFLSGKPKESKQFIMVSFNLDLYKVGASQPVFNAFVAAGIFFSLPK